MFSYNLFCIIIIFNKTLLHLPSHSLTSFWNLLRSLHVRESLVGQMRCLALPTLWACGEFFGAVLLNHIEELVSLLFKLIRDFVLLDRRYYLFGDVLWHAAYWFLMKLLLFLTFWKCFVLSRLLLLRLDLWLLLRLYNFIPLLLNLCRWLWLFERLLNSWLHFGEVKGWLGPFFITRFWVWNRHVFVIHSIVIIRGWGEAEDLFAAYHALSAVLKELDALGLLDVSLLHQDSEVVKVLELAVFIMLKFDQVIFYNI